MGYAMLHEYGANTETPFFTPTGPLFRAFLANRLPFAVRHACVCIADTYVISATVRARSAHTLYTNVTRYYYDIIYEL